MNVNPNARTWSALNGFERDTVVAVLRRGGRPDSDPADRPYGLAVLEEVQIMRDEDVNHSRLYPNLSTLADKSLVTVGKRDDRTNTYAVTQNAVTAYKEYLNEYVGFDTPPSADLASTPADAFDRQTSRK